MPSAKTDWLVGREAQPTHQQSAARHGQSGSCAPRWWPAFATSRVPHRHELRAKVFKSHPVLSDPAGRKVLALVEALEVSSAGIDREAVGAETVRRDVEAICVGRQVDEGCFITALVLDALKRLPQMALQRHTTDDHLAHQFLGASCGKDLGRCRRQFDEAQLLCEVAMVILVALSDGPSTELVRNDGVRHILTEHLCVHEMPKTVRLD